MADPAKEFVNLRQFPVDISDESKRRLTVFPWSRRNEGARVADCTFLVRGDHYAQYVSAAGPLFKKPAGEEPPTKISPAEARAEREKAEKAARGAKVAIEKAQQEKANADTRARLEEETKAAEAKMTKEAEATRVVPPATLEFRDSHRAEGSGSALEPGSAEGAGKDAEEAGSKPAPEPVESTKHDPSRGKVKVKSKK